MTDIWLAAAGFHGMRAKLLIRAEATIAHAPRAGEHARDSALIIGGGFLLPVAVGGTEGPFFA